LKVRGARLLLVCYVFVRSTSTPETATGFGAVVAVAVEVGEGFRVVGDHGVEVESLRVREVGVGDGNWNIGPVGAKPAVEYVVMPEHVHLLMSEAPRKNPSKILQVLKQKVAKALLKKRRRGSDGQLPLPFRREWGRREAFLAKTVYDFNVWSEKKVNEKLEYMHANPVQRKLARHPKDWPWSSWSYYAGRRGIKISMDSAREDTSKK
jgi:REP element-mobilizing transposase RayT